MARKNVKAVGVKIMAPVRHPLKAANLLYSAPGFVMKGPIYIIFIIMFSFITYSFWAKKDELVVAPLVLQKDSVTVESVGGGMVFFVEAKKDETIRSGDLIAVVQEQISITMSPEQESLHSKLEELQKELTKTKDEYEHKISQAELQIKDLETGKQDSAASSKRMIAQLEGQVKTAKRSASRRAEEVTLARKQLNRKKSMYKDGDATIRDLEGAQENFNNARKGYDDAKSNLQDRQLELEKQKIMVSGAKRKQRLKMLQQELSQSKEREKRDLKRLRGRILSTRDRIEEALTLVEGVTTKGNKKYYSSIVSGVVTDIYVKHGQVISPGTPIATIVKKSAVLEGRMLVPNKDIAKIKKGQKVQIKYAAYPYQEYGFDLAAGTTGRVSTIATRPGGVEGKESMYVLKVSLNGEQIWKQGKTKKRDLEIGLEAAGEINTGSKLIIELMFSPISKFFNKEEE